MSGTKPIDHPLEQAFGIESGSTFNPMTSSEEDDSYLAVTPNALPAPAPYKNDEEDLKIDGKINTVYDAALEAFHTQTDMVEIVEPRYAARNAEVAANYLKIALDAAATQAKVKEGKRKSQQFVPFGGTTNNLNVIADRNELLKIMSGKSEEPK